MSFNKLQSLNNLEINLGGLGQAVNEIQAIDNIATKFGAGGSIISGTYLPIITNLVNLGGVNPNLARYMKIGNIVFVSGVNNAISPIALAQWSYNMSLPFPSNITSSIDLGGTFITATTNQIPLSITGDPVNKNAIVTATLTSVANCGNIYLFTYIIK